MVDLVLTPAGVRRLDPAVPVGTIEGSAYRLPTRDPSLLAALARAVAVG